MSGGSFLTSLVCHMEAFMAQENLCSLTLDIVNHLVINLVIVFNVNILRIGTTYT
jgi:hypothetical protein